MNLTIKRIEEGLPELPLVCELMKTAFPEGEQIAMEKLLAYSARDGFDFRAFYDEDRFCGLLYTIENDACLFVLYLAVNDRIRSKGYGSQILYWLQSSTSKSIVLNVEKPDTAAENNAQREKRIAFYAGNGITSTGCEVIYKALPDAEPLAVLSSAPESFSAEAYLALINSVFGDAYQLHKP